MGMKRSEMEMQKESALKRHTLAMEAEAHEARLTQQQAEHEQEVKHKQPINQLELQYFDALKQNGVDLTKYLVCQNQKVEKLVQIQDGSTAGQKKMSMNF